MGVYEGGSVRALRQHRPEACGTRTTRQPGPDGRGGGPAPIDLRKTGGSRPPLA